MRGLASSQSANPVVGLAGSGCRLPFPHLPPVTTSCVISQIRQLSGGLVTHLTQLLRCQLLHQSYVLSLSFLILKIKLLIYQLGILALCLLVKHCQNLKLVNLDISCSCLPTWVCGTLCTSYALSQPLW